MADTTTTATTATSTPATALPLAPGRWALDPYHSRVGFTIRHLGISKVKGHFRRFDAELVVGATPDGTTVTATVEMASIDTGNTDRDAHVLAPDLLDVEQRPEIAFLSTAIRGAGDEWVMDGDLSLGGITRPVTLAVELGGIGAFQGGRHAGFEAHGELRRDDFGLGFGPLSVMLSQVVKLELDLQFVEPSS